MNGPDVVRVRVPATSANLGPGYDALGLALGLYDELSARISEGESRVEISGEGAGELPCDEKHLVVRAMRAAFDEIGTQPLAIELVCRNRIPHARGLGSSSAAIVAGILLARELAGEPSTLDTDAGVLRLAAAMEGHPDNVAPCLLGGMTIAWTEPTGARAVRLEPSATLRPAVFVPAERGLTATARAALPSHVPHADAAANAGRAALLVHALTAEPSLLLAATEDRLHQDYRAPGMPRSAELVAQLRAAGIPAVISGAGPTVLAFGGSISTFSAADFVEWKLDVDSSGARIIA